MNSNLDPTEIMRFKERIPYYHKLRYEILSPLIALDLIELAKEKGTIIQEKYLSEIVASIKDPTFNENVDRLDGAFEGNNIRTRILASFQIKDDNTISLSREKFSKACNCIEKTLAAKEYQIAISNEEKNS